jgi:hypothetical protein
MILHFLKSLLATLPNHILILHKIMIKKKKKSLHNNPFTSTIFFLIDMQSLKLYIYNL